FGCRDRLRWTAAMALAWAAEIRAFGRAARASRLNVTLPVRAQCCTVTPGLAAVAAAAELAAAAGLAATAGPAASSPPPATRPPAASGATILALKSLEFFTRCASLDYTGNVTGVTRERAPTTAAPVDDQHSMLPAPHAPLSPPSRQPGRVTRRPRLRRPVPAGSHAMTGGT